MKTKNLPTILRVSGLSSGVWRWHEQWQCSRLQFATDVREQVTEQTTGVSAAFTFEINAKRSHARMNAKKVWWLKMKSLLIFFQKKNG